MSGTSMAAPYVSGNIALLKQAFPTLTNLELRLKLQETVIDLGSPGKDTWYGYGLIQAPNQKEIISEPIANETIVMQPVVMETKTSMSTDKSSYKAGEKVYIKVNVTDTNSVIISGASVKLTITPPKSKAIVFTGTTDLNGQIILVYSTKRNSLKGTYEVMAEASYVNAKSSVAKTNFQIK